MRLLITSDIHKSYTNIEKLLIKEVKYTHHYDAGDSQFSSCELDNYNIISVRGNTDYNRSLPLIRKIEINNKKILITHGHMQQVKLTPELLKDLCKKEKIDICIFGHTHNHLIKEIDNTLYLNPGSLKYNKTYIIYENNKARLHYLDEE